MNIKRLNSVLFCSLIVCLFTNGCKPRIDEKEVKQLVITSFGLPKKVNRTFYSGDYAQKGMYTYSQANLSHFQVAGYWDLINQGFMEINPRIQQWGSYLNMGYMVFNLRFTDKATPYIVNTNEEGDKIRNRITIKTIDFGGVQELRELENNEYEATISLAITPTPFNEALNKGIWGLRNEIPKSGDNFQSMVIRVYHNGKTWVISPEEITRIIEKF